MADETTLSPRAVFLGRGRAVTLGMGETMNGWSEIVGRWAVASVRAHGRRIELRLSFERAKR